MILLKAIKEHQDKKPGDTISADSLRVAVQFVEKGIGKMVGSVFNAESIMLELIKMDIETDSEHLVDERIHASEKVVKSFNKRDMEEFIGFATDLFKLYLMCKKKESNNA